MNNIQQLTEWLEEAKEKAVLENTKYKKAGDNTTAQIYFGRAWAFSEITAWLGLLEETAKDLFNHCEECKKQLERGTVFCSDDCRRHYYG